MRRSFSAIFVVLSIVTAFAAFGVPVETKWTYQGQLQRSGAAYNGTCNFQFTLWDALSAGTQLGSTQSINSVNVVNGLFTVVLDFDDRFTGDARWLGTSVQCSGDGGFTPLDPRQALTAAPYALSLRPGATIGGFPAGGFLNVSNNQGGSGVFGSGNPGVFGSGVGGNGVTGESGNASSAGVFGINSGTGPGIFGRNTGGGYAGQFVGPVLIQAGYLKLEAQGKTFGLEATAVTGVYGVTDVDFGTGVYGDAQGQGPSSIGVLGRNVTGAAIKGESSGNGSAIYGENTGTGYAGRFVGPVIVAGNLHVTGTLSKQMGSFRIDHPLDPANKFLSHSFVESPDMKNIYDGNVTTDATGSASVPLPAYFETLNRDFRYQLTVLGQFAQAIVSKEIAQNSFEIHTDKPGVKVSWQVTGIRQDAYARAHPIVVEEAKRADEQGMYLYPAGFGAGEEKQIGHSSQPTSGPAAQMPSGAIPSDQGSK
jgi:hypothetical protein